MRIFKVNTVRLAVCLLIVCSAVKIAQAKRLAVADARQSRSSSKHFSSASAMEQSLLPYFDAKANRESIASYRGYVPTQTDLRFIAGNWDSFSDKFKETYTKATTIPADFLSYASPGGHFEIYYTLQGVDAVSPIDTMGYGPTQTTWRMATLGSNGVPDYVDEVAWAFDSAWSMEVERFGFPRPIADVGDDSARYRVKIAEQDANTYGVTFSTGKFPGTDVGYRSYLEIRNQWVGWDINDIIDYETNPLKGVRITAAHEFFHAIQYAMSWVVFHGVYLDDFPVTWIEGSAVLMEDLAFDYVNDYTQYVGDFFVYPNKPVLDKTYNGFEEYKNVVITKYMYERVPPSPGIDFIYSIFKRNAQAKPSFDQNLKLTSTAFGSSWREVLGRFYAESYFSGERADSSLFFKDAGLLPAWSVTRDPLDGLYSVTKAVMPYGMRRFVHVRDPDDPDSVHIQFASTDPNGMGDWYASALLSPVLSGPSSIVEMPFSSGNLARLVVNNWSHYDTVIVVAVNSRPNTSREATVYFTDDSVGISFVPLSDSVAVYPNPARLSMGPERKVRIQGKYLRTVRLYTVDGNLVADNSIDNPSGSVALRRYMQGFEWLLCNNSGTSVSPGTYIAVMGYRDIATDSFERKRQNILVVP